VKTKPVCILNTYLGGSPMKLLGPGRALANSRNLCSKVHLEPVE